MNEQAELKLKSADFGQIRKVRMWFYVFLGVGYGVWLFFTPARTGLDSLSDSFGVSRELKVYALSFSGGFLLIGAVLFLIYLSLRNGHLLLVTNKNIRYKGVTVDFNELIEVEFSIKRIGLVGYGTRNFKVGGGNFLSYSHNAKPYRIEFYLESKKHENLVREFAENLSEKYQQIEVK